MMGLKEKHFKQHPTLCLEDLVPQDNFYREVEAKLDLNFVRELVKDMYCWWNGRPSIDPVVFFKLQVIMFFEGIRSERQLMEIVSMRCDHRWYIGYDFDEPVPDHSSLTNIRDRYGFEVFQKFFEHIVELCIEAGLVWGKEFYFDGSMVKANADYDRQIPKFYWQAIQAHLQQLFDTTPPQPERSRPDLVGRYDGTKPVVEKSRYRKKSDYWVSPIDPYATRVGSLRRLGYRLHYVVDGGKTRIILGCLVTPSAIQDNTPMLDLAWWVRFRWHTQPDIAVGDSRYGTVENIVGLETNGIRAFTPLMTQVLEKKHKGYPRSMFTYDPENNCYICPQGKTLPFRHTDKGKYHVYRAMGKDCRECEVRSRCTKTKNGRKISHSIFKDYLDRVAAYHQTEAYKKAMRKRQVWVEPPFGEVKQWHQGERFRLRGIRKVNIEALIQAAGLNIKRLLKYAGKHQFTCPPAQENQAALAVPRPLLDIRHPLLVSIE